ncbi:MAG: helix-turn-helix domain-containing protein [Nitrospirota bacterium]
MTKRPPNPLTVKELEQIKALRASGLSFHAISKEIKRDPKTVKKACLEPQTANEIQVMKEELANFFEDLARRMITSITEEDIQKINAYQRTLSAGIATDKMRLLKEQSTENIAFHAIVEAINKKEERKIKDDE